MAILAISIDPECRSENKKMSRSTLVVGIALLLSLASCEKPIGTPSVPESETTEVPANTSDVLTETAVQPASDQKRVKEVRAAYGAGWNVDEGWPGEYPNGFSIEDEGVVLLARSAPVLSSERDIACPLEKGASIHPWNVDRVEANDLSFIVANMVLPLDIIKTGSITVWAHDDPESDKTIRLKPGDGVIVTRYYGEGFGEIMLGGVKYTTDLQDVTALSAPNDMQLDEHLWVQLPCNDDASSRVWLLYHEVMETVGVTETPIDEYGLTHDLE